MGLPILRRYARQLHWRCAIVVALRISASSASPSVLSNSVAWSDCGAISSAALDTIVQTECTSFTAPLCHAGVCEDAKNRSVDVHLRRIQATAAPDSAPSVWLLQGGAGTRSPGLHEAMTTLFQQLGGKAHIYTMDQRGTGRSTRLECFDATTSTPLSVASITGAQVATCAKQLEQTLGGATDLAAFSVTSAAADVAAFVAKHHASSKTFVYGVSHGSVLVERLLHLNAPGIVGYVLDAVHTAAGSSEKDFVFESNASTDFDVVASTFVDACSVGLTCLGRSASVSLRDALTNMYADFGAGLASSCAALVVADINSNSSVSGDRQQLFADSLRVLLAKMFVDEQARRLIAPFVHRLRRCSSDDAKVLAHFLARGLPNLKPVFDEDEYTTSLLYRVIAFSEMWEAPAPTPSEIRRRFERSIMSLGSSEGLAAAYCGFTNENTSATCGITNATTAATATVAVGMTRALAYSKDRYWNVAATIPAHASVLVISSQSDALSPHKYAERLVAALKGSAKALFAPTYVAHGSLWWSPFNRLLVSRMVRTTPSMDALVAFVQQSGDLAKLDMASGAASMVAATETSTKVVEELFGTSDAFDGAFGSVSSIGSGDMFDGLMSAMTTIVVVVCSVVALLLVGVVVVIYRRRRAKNQTLHADDDAKLCGKTSSPSTTASFELDRRV